MSRTLAKCWLFLIIWGIGAIWLVAPAPTFAQEVSEGAASNTVVLPSLEDPDGFAPVQNYSAAEKKATCKEYNNKYLSYYDKVYLVENCKLREVQSHDVILELNLVKRKIHVVENSVIAQLDLGAPILESTGKQAQIRPCKLLEKKYVTFAYTDVYYVEGCSKRPFPDWASFIEHRKKLGRIKEGVVALTWAEFNSLNVGTTMDSIVEVEFAKLLSGDAQVDVLPIDEACSGINKRDVAYLDKIYRIESCRKREYDAAKYLRSKNGNVNLKELTSEQWLSIPDGKPMP